MNEAILDGEITWGKAGVVYHVFDILWLDGRDVTRLALVERRALLDALPLTAARTRGDARRSGAVGARV